MSEIPLEAVKAALIAERIVEFDLRGKHYLIQIENNKGWDYLGIWRITSPADCIARALFEIWDGIDNDTVDELFRDPCFDGQTFPQVFPMLENLIIL